ncbi:tigger transposable element-derived protein 1 [Trichonephila clavipes]|nr:tigger transposable element-derived protein 1 [Trichonephila clavipes]
MPTRTYIAKSEKTASGFKAAKDRVTLLLCSNASGDRMLKPLLVNRSLKPRALKGKDLNRLPVHWMANKKAWVTTAIFTEWFNKCFVPEVENYMNEMGLEFKILLILDNAPGHPILEHPNIKEIGGEGFDDFGEHDIEELLVDEALNDDDILESMVDITKDLETVDSEPEEDVTPLDEKLLREGLQLSVPEEALPCRSDDVILSSSDESDLAPIHKRDDVEYWRDFHYNDRVFLLVSKAVFEEVKSALFHNRMKFEIIQNNLDELISAERGPSKHKDKTVLGFNLAKHNNFNEVSITTVKSNTVIQRSSNFIDSWNP